LGRFAGVFEEDKRQVLIGAERSKRRHQVRQGCAYAERHHFHFWIATPVPNLLGQCDADIFQRQLLHALRQAQHGPGGMVDQLNPTLSIDHQHAGIHVLNDVFVQALQFRQAGPAGFGNFF